MTEKRLVNLLRGWPSPHLLPAAQLQAAAARLLSDPSIAVPALQYAPDEGYEPLREELARWLSAQYKYTPHGVETPIPIRADEIAITGGASQGLACVLQSFTDPAYTRAVWAVAPCYFLACPILEDAGFRGRLRAVPEDDGGIDLAALERGLRDEDSRAGDNRPFKFPAPHRKLYRHVIYLVATCANPSGKTLSLARRQQLVHLAREHDALIVSDDVYDSLQWPVTSSPLSTSSSASPKPLPPLLPLLSQIDAALGPSQHNPPHNPLTPVTIPSATGPPTAGSPRRKHFPHAISNGSFSKLVGPGVRTGWVHGATADFALGFSQTGSNRSGGAASQLAAAMVHQLIVTGELQKHLEGVIRPALSRRYGLVMREVEERLVEGLGLGVCAGNGVGGTGTEKEEDEGRVFGGYFVWLTLPEGVDAGVVAERSREEENLIVAPGKLFEVSGDEEAARFPRNIRLCFSWEEEANLVEGVRRLESVLRRMLASDQTGQQRGVRGEVGTESESSK